MGFCCKQISSLEKVRLMDQLNYSEITKKTVFRGERFSYQVALFNDSSESMDRVRMEVETEQPEWVKVYAVKNTIMDHPKYVTETDDDYITSEPGLMPDLLVPMEEQNWYARVQNRCTVSFWVRVDVPGDAAPGTFSVKVKFFAVNKMGPEAVPGCEEKNMDIEVLPVEMAEQNLVVTQWFHTDCIADAHNVEIYSEIHWELIDRYMASSAEIGNNMILVPVITPPLDTMYGLLRPCVQLVGIEKQGDTYTFDFTKLYRWIALSKKNGFKYFEISHLFSQWGMKYAPNILVKENGEESYLFGWDVPASSDAYAEFLKQFLPQLVQVLEEEGIAEHSFFHVSDEPHIDHLETYERYAELIKPLIGSCKRMDALSNYAFYEKGLLEVPVTASNHMDEFLKHEIENQWVYYCCGQGHKVSNRFIAMPSYRNRVMGLQMYKSGVKGFLQWGFNFYYAERSMHQINPYQTTSGDLAFPSGDPFTVYPGKDGPLHSLRGLVFHEGLQDLQVCRTLERYVGKEAVVRMIDEAAGMDLQFDQYPRSADFLLKLRETMTNLIREYVGC